ncbi:MAG: hypothetical protein KJO66_04755 [Gammaproteobacteria bacterium]|nr:hypothetical protein [Gammaproteobacteria bacterium]NNJ93517.1 hypothetical protein [Halobacteria archaeon]
MSDAVDRAAVRGRAALYHTREVMRAIASGSPPGAQLIMAGQWHACAGADRARHPAGNGS